MILGCPLLTVKGYRSGTRSYTSEGCDKILKCQGGIKSGSVKFSTSLLCKVLYFSDAGGLNIILQRNWISENDFFARDYSPTST